MPDADLLDLLVHYVVEWMLAPEGEREHLGLEVERLHRERSKRHRVAAEEGCSCANCFQPYEALRGW